MPDQTMIERVARARYARLFGHVIALKSSDFPALFSERNRIGVRVIPLIRGWRITVRKIDAALEDRRNG